MNNNPFWMEDPNVLFSSADLIPTQTMTNSERLNALTRLLLVIVIVMYMMGNDQYLTTLAIGLLLIVLLRNTQKEGFSPRRGNHDPCKKCGFDSNLAYINTKYETTPMNQYTHVNDGLRSYTHAHYKVIPPDVPAPYRKVWRPEARWCNEFTRYPESYDMPPANSWRYIEDFNGPSTKCHYRDTEHIDILPGGACPQRKHSAMPAIQSAFTRDSSIFRNNIMGDYIDQIERTRQHNCVGFKPGRKTF